MRSNAARVGRRVLEAAHGDEVLIGTMLLRSLVELAEEATMLIRLTPNGKRTRVKLEGRTHELETLDCNPAGEAETEPR